MGILNRRDVFTGKYTTALILDSSNRAWFVPIKATISEYFIADLDHQLYIFKIDGAHTYTYRHTASKSFNLMVYSTKHYRPLSAEVVALQNLLSLHSLPKVGNNLMAMLNIFSKEEKVTADGQLIEPHDIPRLVQALSERPDAATSVVRNLVMFMENLAVDQIVKPVRSISEFLDTDLMATDPKFLGLVAQTLNTNLEEQRKLANRPVTGRGPIMKVAAIGVILAAVAAVGYIMLGDGGGGGGGLADSLGGALGGETAADRTRELTSRYAPDELIEAIRTGEVPESDITPELRNLLEQHVRDKAAAEAVASAEAAEQAEIDAALAAFAGTQENVTEAVEDDDAAGFIDALNEAIPGLEVGELPDAPAPEAP